MNFFYEIITPRGTKDGKWGYRLDTGTEIRRGGLATEEAAYQALAEAIVAKHSDMEFILKNPIRYLRK